MSGTKERLELAKLQSHYFEVLNQQEFQEQSLDYTILEHHTPLLQNIARIGNSVVTVFDLYQKKHIFAAGSLGKLMGYSAQQSQRWCCHVFQVILGCGSVFASYT